MPEELYTILGLKQGDKAIFSHIFKTYYKDLVIFAGNLIPEKTVCEDVVQNVFTKLWNDRNKIEIETSLKSYLLKSVYNCSLDEIRHRKIIQKHESYTLSNSILHDVDTENYILYSDLHKHLSKALLEIPDSYRTAFELNRFEGLKYKEIAKRLNVSERTVEVRISKALVLLKEKLKDFVVYIAFLFKIFMW